MRDGLRDLVELAAPQPIVVGQIGIALGAAAAGTVTGRAIVGKSAAAQRAGVGKDTPLKIERGLNALWSKGGLQYAEPIR